MLKKAKMYEKELAKLEGQQMMLEQQRMMITENHYDSNVMSSLKSGLDQGKSTLNELMAEV